MTTQYKCPCCGGTIAFDSATQKMKCPYCDSTFDVESLKAYDDVLSGENAKEESADIEDSRNEWDDETLRHYVCPSCGGEIITNETLASTVCPYCSNNVILMDKFEGDLKPDCVIPFKIDRKNAMDLFRRSLKGKHLLSKSFSTENRIESVKGVYVPFWLFSGDSDSSLTYRATRVETWADPNYTYTKTNHYLLHREGSVHFDYIPVDGSSVMDDSLMEALGPFDFSSAVDFQTAYLSGYLADRYDITQEEGKPRALERARTSVEKLIRATAQGFTGITKETEKNSFTGGKCRYGLFPVWLINATWKGRTYLYAVNGETGKFVGNLPLDKKKSFFSWLAATVILGSVFLLGFYCVWAL